MTVTDLKDILQMVLALLNIWLAIIAIRKIQEDKTKSDSRSGKHKNRK